MDIFVSPFGKDGSIGSETSPWQTLRYAMANIPNDSTVTMRNGEYTGVENTVNTQDAEAPQSNITLQAYPGEQVTLRPPWGHSAVLLIAGRDNWKFKKFSITGIDHSGGVPTSMGAQFQLISIQGGSHHNLLEDLELFFSLGDGVGITQNNGDSHSNHLLRCWMHDNGLDISMSNPGYGLYSSCSRTLVELCRAERNHGYGLHFNGASVSESRVTRSIVAYNYPWGGAGPGGNTGGGIAVMSQGGEANDVIIDNNRIYRNGLNPNNPNTNGMGVFVFTNTRRMKVFMNTIVENKGAPIQAQYYAEKPEIKGNIFYLNGNNDQVLDIGGEAIIEENFNSGNPLFIDLDNDDFNLQRTSPAMNTVTPIPECPIDTIGTSRPQGEKCDAGAYEVILSSVPVPPTPTEETYEVSFTGIVKVKKVTQ